MPEKIASQKIIPLELGGLRLDQALAKLYPEFSRTQLKHWIEEACLLVNDKVLKPRTIVIGGEQVNLEAEIAVASTSEAEAINLAIIYEDENILVVNKPAGMVVHPAPGNREHTLVNALLYHHEPLKYLPRAGIIHRLDKDTSGLLVVAKTEVARHSLISQLKERSILREYQAIVTGDMTGGGRVDAPIGRHPVYRKRMAVIDSGKDATSHYRILEKYTGYARINVRLETGRTHQIRVHMSHIQHTLVGDKLYGYRLRLPKNASPSLMQCLRDFKRQALHAYRLGLLHPISQEYQQWEAPLPEDMLTLINALREK